MVQCLGGGTVAVIVGGEAAEEYEVVRKTEDGAKTYTCYVEAKEGKEYEVVVNDFPMIKQGKFKAVIFIDGREADRYIQCAYQSKALRKHSKNEYTFTGFLAKGEDGKEMLRSFAFSKIKSTNDEEARAIPSTELDKMCTIRVEITQTARLGGIRHDYVTPHEPPTTLPVNPIVHEESKPAQLGLATGFGQEKVDEVGITCRCVVDEEVVPERIIVTFKYIPYKWLGYRGFVETEEHADDSEDIDDSDFEIDIERTEASARRREREGMTAQERSVRIKTEAPTRVVPQVKQETDVKRESTLEPCHEDEADGMPRVKQEVDLEIKEEPTELNMDEAFDLTGEGDFVFPPRRVGDSIIIEDE